MNLILKLNKDETEKKKRKKEGIIGQGRRDKKLKGLALENISLKYVDDEKFVNRCW